jgi:hypothetical protein
MHNVTNFYLLLLPSPLSTDESGTLSRKRSHFSVGPGFVANVIKDLFMPAFAHILTEFR